MTQLTISRIRAYINDVKEGKECSCGFSRKRQEFNSVLKVYSRYKLEQYKMRKHLIGLTFANMDTQRQVGRHNELNEHLTFYRKKLVYLAPCPECRQSETVGAGIYKKARLTVLTDDGRGKVGSYSFISDED